MKTVVQLEASTSYYEGDDGTFDRPAALFEWPEPLDYPPLQPRMTLRLGGEASYHAAKAIVEPDGSQSILCRCNLGYNRYRSVAIPAMQKKGWKLIREYEER
jgi:hypothetical protein